MTARKLFLVLALALAGGLFPGRGRCLDVNDKLEFEGKAYIRYWYQLQDPAVQGAGEDEPRENSFEVWRFYFGPKVKLSPWLKLRLTADVGPEKTAATSEADDGHSHAAPDDTRYAFYIKYAYADMRLAPSLFLKAGMLGNPYSGFTDKLWGGRYVTQNAGNANKLWHSADLGLNLYYQLPKGLGEVGVGFVNGSGYKKALDDDTNKQLWIHAALSPLASFGELASRFKLAALLQYDVPMGSDDTSNMLLSGMLGYKCRWLAVGYQLMTRMAEADDVSVIGLGHGAYLRVNTPWQTGLLGHLAVWDADTDSDAVQTGYEALGGVFYKPVSAFEVAAVGAAAWSSDVDGVEEEADLRFILTSQVKF